MTNPSKAVDKMMAVTKISISVKPEAALDIPVRLHMSLLLVSYFQHWSTVPVELDLVPSCVSDKVAHRVSEAWAPEAVAVKV